MKKALTIAAVALALAAPAHAEWEKFDALCGSSRKKCRVSFDGEKMTMPGLTIFAEDVITWNLADNTDRRCGWYPYVGYYCSRKEDQRILIKYMGSDGSRQIAQVAFINHKPARTFINMMGLWSGLQSGYSRGVNGVVQGATRTAALDASTVEAFEDVTVSPNARPKGAHNIGLRPGTSVGSPEARSTPASGYNTDRTRRLKEKQAQRKCWSKYMENPAMKQWADANPAAAEKVKAKKYDDC